MLFTPDEKSVDTALAVLNETLKQDPRAMRDLLARHEVCNRLLAVNDTVQVRYMDDSGFSVGVLGLINGILGVYPNGNGPIGAVVEDNGEITKFIRMPGTTVT